MTHMKQKQPISVSDLNEFKNNMQYSDDNWTEGAKASQLSMPGLWQSCHDALGLRVMWHFSTAWQHCNQSLASFPTPVSK